MIAAMAMLVLFSVMISAVDAKCPNGNCNKVDNSCPNGNCDKTKEQDTEDAAPVDDDNLKDSNNDDVIVLDVNNTNSNEDDQADGIDTDEQDTSCPNGNCNKIDANEQDNDDSKDAISDDDNLLLDDDEEMSTTPTIENYQDDDAEQETMTCVNGNCKKTVSTDGNCEDGSCSNLSGDVDDMDEKIQEFTTGLKETNGSMEDVKTLFEKIFL